MTKISNRTVLITGGASGIGKLLAKKCLEQKAYKLILWDINEKKLMEAKDEFYRDGYDVYTDTVDVADLEDVIRASEKLKKEIAQVDILFNNAGIVVGKSFEEHSHLEISKTIDINVKGLMHVTLEFLAGMIDKGEGHIVNIASAAGLIANPNMSVYVASKWAVVGWSESLRLEQELQETGVRVTTVMPSYISTGMFAGIKSPLFTPTLDPEYVVDKIIQAVKNNSIILIEPKTVRTLPFLKGVLPIRAFDFVAGKLFGIYKSMDGFVGRSVEESMPDKEKLKAIKKKKEEEQIKDNPRI
jgi:all-trans-retinol dehydrogenase (NAD+)